MEMLIITGLSGSGKSKAVNCLEDIGFFCVDNLPPKLISKVAQIGKFSVGGLKKLAVVTDIRGGQMFSNIFEELEILKKNKINYKILFLDASDETLKKRFNETRRKHPLIGVEGCFNINQAIFKERQALAEIKNIANFIVDTTGFTTAQLKSYVSKLFLQTLTQSLIVDVVSFGFKYGDITRADLVFDVRCLPNPHYIASLKHKTGLNLSVKNYIMSFEVTQKLLDKLSDLFEFLLPLYIKEGKSQLTIAFGCTGGAHRSVMFAQHFYSKFLENGNKVNVIHRDIEKNKKIN